MISKETIGKAVKIMVDAASPVSVILFGSYARNEANDQSDLDFLIIEPGVINRYEEMVRLRRCLSPLKIPADVLVHSEDTFNQWRSVPGTILNTIASEGKVVYERPC